MCHIVTANAQVIEMVLKPFFQVHKCHSVLMTKKQTKM